MFIELTDHLRCPVDHDESFLVLIPDQMRGREVLQGILGCPVCQREYRIVDGVVRFDEEPGPVVTDSVDQKVDARAIAAFMGLEGPGGYVGLIGEAAGLAAGLSQLLPGIHLVVVNPPASITATESLSLLQSPGVPFKRRSLRGIVLGSPFGTRAGWPEAAVHSVLPGLRAVGQGPTPDFKGFELLGEAEGWWVGKTGG